jgi:hypothetical protein
VVRQRTDREHSRPAADRDRDGEHDRRRPTAPTPTGTEASHVLRIQRIVDPVGGRHLEILEP